MKTTPAIQPTIPPTIPPAIAPAIQSVFSALAASILSLSICATPAAASTDAASAAPAGEKPNPILAKLGGLVTEPMDGMPDVVILDMRKDSGSSTLAAEVAARMTDMMRVPFRVQTQAGAGASPLAAAAALASATNRVAAIVLCDDGGSAPALPSLLAAPEARWAVVNAAPLKAGSPSGAQFDLRVRKELWRAAALAMGASHSEFPLCLMKPVFTPEDLDALPLEDISAEPLGGIRQQFRALGTTPARKSFYRKACEEGWAPPPTNDIQRAIWDAAAAKRNNAE